MDDRALERLKWRSRRGLLELDIAFAAFWAGPGSRLSEGEAATLERMLAMPDNDLLDLVLGRSASPDPAIRDLIAKMKAA